MSDYDALRQLYRQLPAEEPSANLDAKVLAAVNAELEAEREQRARRQRRWRYQVPLATAATLVLAVALLLRLPDSRQELLEHQPDTSQEMSSAYESRAGIVADSVNAPARPPVMQSAPPPPPPPVAMPPPVIAPPAMVAAPAPAPAPAPAMELAMPSVMGFMDDRALKQASNLEKLLKEAPGMAAPEFCTRLRALWAATEATGGANGEATGEAAPECPTTDGNHQWPAPLSMAWQVNAGLVQKAELRR
ncbi:MAG: hypothetical protein RJB26_1634 [Pseudomonadota bacterium]|jgi:type IV secretory pathway VirB10-like protein